MYTKEERFKLATEVELYQVSMDLGKKKKYLVRIRGKNQLPLMKMTVLGKPGSDKKRGKRYQECNVVRGQEKNDV